MNKKTQIVGLVMLLLAVTAVIVLAVRKPAWQKLQEEQQQETVMRLYFSNSNADPNALHCDVTYPVTRELEEGVSAPRLAMEQLVAGVTTAEANKGYFSNINDNVTLEDLQIVDGRASVTFSENFQAGMGGSCRVTAITSQITETLKQFPEVKEVVVHVTGVPDEEVLQP